MVSRTLMVAALAGLLLTSAARSAAAQGVDWSAADRAMGRAGRDAGGGVHKYSMPRTDLAVTVRAVRVRPALALGSWLAMKPRPDGGVVAMGDLVLTQDEVGPVMSKLQEGGITQTALHNHLLFETPRVMFMHVHGEGSPEAIARAVRAALALTGTPGFGAGKAAGVPAEDSAGGAGDEDGAAALDTAGIAGALGRAGTWSGGVYKVSVPRDGPIHSSGIEVPPSMGTGISLGFQPVGKGRAATTGDFVLTASEVNPVLRVLRGHGIVVTALHNHMLSDDPHLFFVHFWGVGDAVELARGLRVALEHVDVAAPAGGGGPGGRIRP